MKIAIITNTGWDFLNSRVRFAQFLLESGHEVTAIIPEDGYKEKIEEQGIRTLETSVDLRKIGPHISVKYALNLIKIFREEKFDVVHCIKRQPNLIGTPTAFFFNHQAVVINNINGLGTVFMRKGLKFWIMRKIIKYSYNLNQRLFGATMVVQNEDDAKELGITAQVIRGSAVNETIFHPERIIAKNKNEQELSFLFVSRLLKDKGLSELVEAVNHFNQHHRVPKIKLVIAGEIDPGNPSSYTMEEIEVMKKVRGTEFLGRRNDVDQLLIKADVAILPSYREGAPRFLLEAMASGKPIVTTDTPGCRQLYNGKNGFLVRKKSKEDLIEVFSKIGHVDLQTMGKESYIFYKENFAADIVYNSFIRLYNSRKTELNTG